MSDANKEIETLQREIKQVREMAFKYVEDRKLIFKLLDDGQKITETLSEKTGKLNTELLTMKFKMFLISAIGGFLGTVVSSVTIFVLSRVLFKTLFEGG